MPNSKFKNLNRDVSIERNQFGVPQIYASSQPDAYYGLGYIHAFDRRTQMMFARCLAAGEAAEQISSSEQLLQSDRYFRRIGLARDLLKHPLDFTQFQSDLIESYVEGVNDAMKIVWRTLPMWLTGFRPKTWDVQSVLLVGKLLAFGALAINQMRSERLIIEMIHAGVSEEGLKELFASRLDDADFDLIRQIKLQNKLSDEALGIMTELPTLSGSNAWAISPSRTETGNAMLCSDPHLECNRFPAVWYEAILDWKDDFMMGASLPGCPLFAVCRMKNIAWGVTHMKGDCVDYFIEDCRRTNAGVWQYRREDQWHDFEVIKEQVHSKKGERYELKVYRSDVGTLEVDPLNHGEGLQLAFDWTGAHGNASEAIGVWLNLTAASSTSEAMTIASDSTQPTLCWTFADSEGHIGMQSSGRFPVRGNGHNGLTPIPAWNPKNHWQGWTAASDLYSIYDPPEGFVCTANEELPSNGRMLITQPYPDYRYRRIKAVLGETEKANLQNMQSLHYDFISTQAHDLVPLLTEHLDDSPEVKLLREWNGSFNSSSKQAAIYHHLYHEVIREIFGKAEGLGKARIDFLTSLEGYIVMMVAVFDRTLPKSESWWWKDRDKGEMIRAAWRRALDKVDANTTWDDVNQFQFADRFIGSCSLARWLGIESRVEGMPGNHSTVFQGHVTFKDGRLSSFSPAYHFIVDMGSEEAHTNLAGGPRENPFSKYYKSDLLRWRKGEYKRLTRPII